MANQIIQKIIEKLKKYPNVTFSTTDDTITVDPKNEKGFSVSMGIGPKTIIVSSGNWHEHFNKDEEDQALNCFAFLLSDSCRLKVEYRGQKPKRWTIESFEGGKWTSGSTTGVFNFNFWSAMRTEYFQNDLIKTRG